MSHLVVTGPVPFIKHLTGTHMSCSFPPSATGAENAKATASRHGVSQLPSKLLPSWLPLNKDTAKELLTPPSVLHI